MYDKLYFLSILTSPEDAHETKAYNTIRVADAFYKRTAHEAVRSFMELHFNGQIFHGLRDEQPFTDDMGRLWTAWSCLTAVSGQALYIKAQIGGYDAKDLTPAKWRSNK